MTSQARPRPWGAAALPLGLAATGWAAASMAPWGWPAWPGASLGILAIATASLPGPSLFRGLGAFAGLLGIVVSGVQILALWGVMEALDR